MDFNKLYVKALVDKLNSKLSISSEDLVKLNAILGKYIKAEPEIEQPVIAIPNAAEVEDFGTTETKPLPISSTPIVWGTQQATALDLIYKWLRTSGRNQIFRLFGPAGVGKTMMAKAIADFVTNEQGKQGVPKGEVLYAAYTGKAASVLRRNGCLNASTLHSLVYKPVIDVDTGKCIGFTLNHESPIATAALLVIDECSMVDSVFAADILNFGTPVLVLGDPHQLPPIFGDGFFTNCDPDYLLTDIRRQAKDNPIIYLATRVRQGKELKPGTYGESIVYDYGNYVNDELVESSAQIIVGLNATRKNLNTRVRKLNGKFEKNPIFPVKGDRLIATKNNVNKTIFNGTIWHCNQPTIGPIMQAKFKNSKYKVQGSTDVLKFKVKSEDELNTAGKPLILDTQCSMHHFDTRMDEPNWRDIAGADSFDFSYAITAHKCVHPETMVETLEGYLPIRLIADNGSIATDTGAHSYLNKVVNEVSTAIRTICENNYSITTTVNHKMEVWREGVSHMVEAEHVLLGDWMRLKLGATIDIKNYFKLPDLKDVKFDSRITKYKLPTHCDEEVGELLGYLAAKGFLTKNKQGFKFINEHSKVLARYKKLINILFGIKVKQCAVRNSYNCEVRSNYLGVWLNLILDADFNSVKTIPECIYRSPMSVQAAFIKGLFSSSSLAFSNKNTVESIEFNSTSAALVQKIQQMLLRFGIISTTRTDLKNAKLYIYGMYVKLFVSKIGFINLPSDIKNSNFIDTEVRFRVPISIEDLAKLESYGCVNFQNRANFLNKGYLSRSMCKRFMAKSSDAFKLLENKLSWHWVRVVKKSLGIAPSMCVEVPEGHKFLQNGFPHSNSQGSQFESVLIFDESQSFREYSRNWLYTSITRGVEKIIIQM